MVIQTRHDCGNMRLGHMSERGLAELHKRKLLNGIKTCKLKFYEDCVFGKQHHVKFPTAVHHTKGALDYIHGDVLGRAPVRPKGGTIYFVIY